MTSRKSRRQRARERRKKASPEVLRRQGAEAFRRGDYDLAMAAWRRISRAERDPGLTTAFAEACFRRGLAGHLDSLRQAVGMAGDEPLYHYHLALAYHRIGHAEEAEPIYRRVLDQAKDGSGIIARATYSLGLLLLETDRRPSRDPLWERLEGAAEGSSLAQTRQRLAHAEHLIFARSAPTVPAPDALWAALVARRTGQEDPTPVDPTGMVAAAAAIAQHHLAARAWEQGDVERAFAYWHAAHDVGLDLPQLKDNLFAAARTVATERLKSEKVEGALEAASVGLAIQPGDNGLQTIAGQSYFRLGRAAATAGRWEVAFEHWQAALKVGGERSRRLIINLALAEEQRENWHEAAELWREALRRRPRKTDHPDALDDMQVARLWRHVAENYQRSGQTFEALDTFRNALKWTPDDAELRTAYVDMLLDDGRLVAADNQLDILLQAHPNDVELLDRRAQLYAGQGYSNAAINVWKKILDLQPDHPSARRQIARHFERKGDDFFHWGWQQKAISNYQAGLEFAPDDGMLLASVGMCQLDMDDEKLARQFFERACAAEPQNPDVYLLVIKTWLDHDCWDDAEAVIQRAREAMVPSAVFFLDIADYCYDQLSSDLAEDYLVQARALAADDVNLLLAIADMAGRNHRHSLAQEVVEDALKLDPDNAMAHVIMGLTLVSQGNLGAARRSWTRAENIARKTNNKVVLMAVEEMRFLYDPNHGPPLAFLRRMIGGAFLDPEEPFDDEDWS